MWLVATIMDSMDRTFPTLPRVLLDSSILEPEILTTTHKVLQFTKLYIYVSNLNPAIKFSSEIQKADTGLLFMKSIIPAKIILVFICLRVWS